MLRIGVAGIGFMGMVHYLSYQKIGGVCVGAIAEPDAAKRSGDWRSIRGNFGPPGEVMDLSGLATYATLDELIADPSLDAIDVTLPPSMHADAVVRALEAGKHVFCEKPMAMSLADCDRMQRVAERAGRVLLVGHVLPYFPEYAWALGVARGGELGALLGGSFYRVISDPAWLTRYWSQRDIGGPMLDLHVHDAHFVRLLFGMPTAVTTVGRSRPSLEGGELPEHWTTLFEFPAGPDGHSPSVTATSGVIAQQGRPFRHAFELHFERGTLVFDFAVMGERGAYLCPPTLLAADGAAIPAELSGGDPMDAFRAEAEEVVRCFLSGGVSDVLGAGPARDAIAICQAQSRSLAENRRASLVESGE